MILKRKLVETRAFFSPLNPPKKPPKSPKWGLFISEIKKALWFFVP
jgi:hypothetical protein